jgi:hypothetical protein
MREIYQMFQGATSPERVLAVGDDDGAEFYSHLYVGLYYEALGRKAEALTHISAAAQPRYANAGGYMHMVARVHLISLKSSR